MTGYAQKDFATDDRRWRPRGRPSADGLTWTYKLRPSVKWSDGQPLTAADVAYTFNRVINGTYEQTNCGNYVANITKASRTDPTTVVMTIKKPTPIMYHLSGPDPAASTSGQDQREGRRELRQRADARSADRRVRPVHADPGRQGPVHPAGRATRTTGAPPTHIDHLVFRVFNSQDSMAQALEARRDRLRRQPRPRRLQRAEGGRQSITTVDAKYSGFDEIAMNTGAALDAGTPIGNGNPALKDGRSGRPSTTPSTGKTLVDKVFGGYGQRRHSIIPPLYAEPALRAGRLTTYTVQHRQGQPAARPGRLHQGQRRHPADARGRQGR